MNRSIRPRAVLAAAMLAPAALTAAVLAGPPALAAGTHTMQPAAHAAAAGVSVRVEGISKTLLAATTLTTAATSIDPDHKPADACNGDTAAVALQQATKGDWTAGPFSKGLGYSVIGIDGESHPFSSPYYWSLWIDGKPASTGICGAKLHSGESILFFPQCSKTKASQCPQGNFDPNVLEVDAPNNVSLQTSFTVTVMALSNAKGKAAPGAGAKVTIGGQTATTDSHGDAAITLTKSGDYTLIATAKGAVRDELKVHAS